VVGAVGLLCLALATSSACSASDDGSDGASRSEKRTTTTMTAATTAAAAARAARDFSGAGRVVIAHRGASLAAPEHTFAAYDLAMEQGADYLEQDVQLTKDGRLVVLHDPSLERTVRGPAASCTGLVSDHTVEDLAACEAGSWFNEAHPDLADDAYSTQTIPTLDQVLDRYLTDARYYIEVKAPDDQPEMVPTLLALIAKAEADWADVAPTDGELPRFVIQSFSADSLRAVHEERPDLPLVQLIRNGEPVPDGAALDAIAEYAVAIGPPKTMATSSLIADANDRCLDVHPYTIDDPAEMATVLDAGAGGMFSDDPGALRRVVAAQPEGDALCPATATAG
jgi:glycerophosphoryl diester phosphodiesterase